MEAQNDLLTILSCFFVISFLATLGSKSLNDTTYIWGRPVTRHWKIGIENELLSKVLKNGRKKVAKLVMIEDILQVFKAIQVTLVFQSWSPRRSHQNWFCVCVDVGILVSNFGLPPHPLMNNHAPIWAPKIPCYIMWNHVASCYAIMKRSERYESKWKHSPSRIKHSEKKIKTPLGTALEPR